MVVLLLLLLQRPQPVPAAICHVLLHLFTQALRNTVPVPRHWSQKRRYLVGKKGIEKPPFKLPEFIEATGE